MCFFLSPNLWSSILVTPTSKARRLSDYLKVALLCQLFLIVGLLISGRILESIIDTTILIIGIGVIRSSEGYNYQQLKIYMIMNSVNLMLSFIRLLFVLFSKNTVITLGLPLDVSRWRFDIAATTMIAAPQIYCLAVTISYFLYQQLRSEITELSEHLNMESQQFAVQQNALLSQYGGATSGSDYPSADALYNPNQSSQSNFKPFAGRGYRLNEI